MLNQAARYYPILRVLQQHQLLDSNSVLEIGAGPIGMGLFRKLPFVGCDLVFPSTPSSPMTPILASATALPFRDNTFDAVIASDVLEHVPPSAREIVIQECLRVAGKLAIFGFPCGETAQECDRNLFELYKRKHLHPPLWLQEHMLAAFPELNLIRAAHGWRLTSFGNENIRFHSWMMRMEMHRLFNYAMKASILLAPRLLEFVLRRKDSAPYYRQIFVLSRAEADG